MCSETNADGSEITPEMIEAGLSAYRDEGRAIEDADNSEKERIFTAIFCAMVSASRRRAEKAE